jgi:Domain of unknown function (DUF4349)
MRRNGRPGLRGRRSRGWFACLAAAALGVGLAAGCSGGGSAGSAGSTEQRGVVASTPAPGGRPGLVRDTASGAVKGVRGAGAVGAGSAGAVAGAAADVAAAAEQRREVVTAQVTVRTRDVASARSSVRRAAEAAQGFVSDEYTTSEGGREQTELTVRVPAAALDDVMDRAAATGTAMERSRTSEDVSGTYVDTASRVRSQRASVERVRTLLGRATTIGQVVQVESELARREADLESLEAQLKRLDEQTSLATLTVSLVPPPTSAPVRAAGFGGGLRAGWHALGAAVSVLLVMLGAALPFALLGAALAGPAVVLLRRRRRPAAAPAP